MHMKPCKRPVKAQAALPAPKPKKSKATKKAAPPRKGLPPDMPPELM